MRVRPVTPERLVTELAERIAARPGWVRVAIDGPDAAQPDKLADALVGPLRARGRPVIRVRAADHLRPASLRLERGREDPDAFYDDWLDVEGLAREVLRPLDPGGSGHIRPVRFDAAADRASRTPFMTADAGTVLLLSGPLLLGRGLPLDLTVHIVLTPAALRRRTPAPWQWTLPAFARYDEEVDPASWADVVIRADDPRHVKRWPASRACDRYRDYHRFLASSAQPTSPSRSIRWPSSASAQPVKWPKHWCVSLATMPRLVRATFS
jgi:hypothetical protein